MRFFIAVVPPEPAVRDLMTFVHPLRDRYPRLHWSDPSDWHITLAFLGEVEDSHQADLSAALTGVARSSCPVRLRLAGSGHFDSRVLWIGVAGEVGGLHGLADAARAAVRNADLDHDPRPLQPHVTVAHAWRRQHNDDLAVDSPPDLRPVEADLADVSGIPWTADRLLLMSVRSQQAPRYGVVESWPLEGESSAGLDQRA